MLTRIKVLVLVLLWSLFPTSLSAQSTTSPLSDMEIQENELLRIIDQMSTTSDNLQRLELNVDLIEKIEETFSDLHALTYPFDKLHAISDLKNTSGDFRIFTWELPDENDINSYFGVICYVIDKESYTYILHDSSQSISNPEFTNLTSERWYGALYYDFMEFSYKKDRQIILLGINRTGELIKERVIEIIDFGEEIRFGKEVFVIPNNSIGLKRKIYQYSIEADMSIWFEKDKDIILMDHLAPLKSMYEGKFEYYAPDLSFDALTYKKGKWYYEADYDARMEKTSNDRFFEMELEKQKKIY